ncbi:hypothetical protein KR074_004527 [Drosophila pseudoananassae]|nr:hypothetical protein KR074_004527 [Drosophila pseudoananassae]
MKWILFFVAAFAQSLASSDSGYDFYRLPTALRPQKYHLSILTHLDNPEDLKFEGTVKIIIEVLENTKNITLHSKSLAIEESRTTLYHINGQKGENCINSTAVNAKHGYYILNTCQELIAGNIYELSLAFSAKLSTELRGYYRSSYIHPKDNKIRWISSTQFEPTSARRAFPCFDEPALKASFVITLGYHKNYTGLSNMPVKETRPHEHLPDYIWVDFEESLVMSTYLVAYSVNDFAHITSTVENGPVFRTWASYNVIRQCLFASKFGPKVLRFFEELFEIKFPLTKIDQIAVPDFKDGAMENWGLVVYQELNLLFSSEESVLSERRVAYLIAHELAHQWFGNLVTMNWWTDLWLNEGFATFVGTLGVDYIYPEWHYKDMSHLNDLLVIFKYDSLESSHPISTSIKDEGEIKTVFNPITYCKGSAVLRTTHSFLGEESFTYGLKTYLNMYAYKNAESDNLWEMFTQSAHKFGVMPRSYDVKTIMDSWILQKGFPVINITRDYATRTANLSQERFVLISMSSDLKRKGCWWVPLSYTTQADQDFNNTSPKVWLECDEHGRSPPKTVKNLPGPDEWVIFNNQFSTLCIINYDTHNWNLLIKTLTTGDFESFHIMNRAQLINDVLYLAWIGEQDYETAFGLVEYLKREREYLPWNAADESLEKIKKFIHLTPSVTKFKSFIKKIISPIYESLNTTVGRNPNPDKLMLLSITLKWACYSGVEDCIEKAVATYQSWRTSPFADDFNPVPKNVRDIFYCTAIEHGNDEDWEFMWNRYQNSSQIYTQVRFLNALGCSRDDNLLQRYLELIFDQKKPFKMDQFYNAFIALVSTQMGFELARKFILNNVDLVYQQ